MTDRDHHAGRWLAAVVLAGAVLRVWGLWFGLPHAQARPDEVEAVSYALKIAHGDLNPRFFHWPSLHLYVLAFLFRAAIAVREIIEPARATPPFEHLVLIGRAYVAAAGVLTIPVLYFLARCAAGKATAVGAALLLAVAPLHVRDSHFAMTDVTMTLLVTLSLWLIVEAHLRIRKSLSTQRAVGWRRGLQVTAAAGFVGGLAVGTKYSAAAVLMVAAASQIMLAASTPWRRRPSTWAPLLVFLAASAVGFLMATPYALLDFPTFRADLMFNFGHLAAGHGPDLGPGWIRHLTFSLPHGLGVTALLAAGVGTLVALWRSSAPLALVLVFVATFYVGIGGGQTVFARYVLPMIPAGALLAALGVEAASRLRGRVVLAFPLLLVLVAAPSVTNSVWLDVLLSRVDTRVLAARWLSARLPPDSTMFESGREYVSLSITSPRLHRWYYDPSTRHFAGATPDMLPGWLVLHRSPLAEYTPVPPSIGDLARERYVVIREFPATRGEGDPGSYDQQDAFFLPMTGFRNVLRPGPTIVIYARRDLVPGVPREP